MNYIDSAQRERSRAFDILQQNTHEALCYAGNGTLGELGVRLAAANEISFLPNVRHGVISIPTSRQNTNGGAVLPMLEGDEALTFDDTLMAPTPSRRQRMIEELSGKGLDPSEESLRAISERQVAAGREEYEEYFLPREENSMSARTTSILPFVDEPAVFTSRPIIVHSPKRSPELVIDRQFKAVAHAHELTHVVDSEELAYCLPGPVEATDYKVLTEARAYGVGSAILAAMIASENLPEITQAAVEEREGNTLAIAKLLKQFEVNPSDLFKDDFQFGDEHSELIGTLLFEGYLG